MAPESRRAEPRYPGDQLSHAVLGPGIVEIFENLYSAYAADARRAAYAVLQDADLAADAAHSGFLELLRYVLAGKRWYEPAEARAAVVRNSRWAALKMLRLRQRRREAATADVAWIADEATWARAEARTLCDQIVAQLPPAQRVALRLHYVEGLSVPDAARRLGVSASAFESRLARAVRAARRAARRLGLVGLVGAAVCTMRSNVATMLRRAVRSAVVPVAGATARIAAAVLVTAVTGSMIAHALAPSSQPTPALPPSVALAAAVDTPEDAAIVDAIRPAPDAIVLLAEKGRCDCEIVFASRDSGRTWSAMSGPARRGTADHLVVSRLGRGDLYISQADGGTFSSPELSAWAQRSALWTAGTPGPWRVQLSQQRFLLVDAGHRLHCSSDGGVTWHGGCAAAG
jgi:RNA polymerase sigma factor (sigma-70 family)